MTAKSRKQCNLLKGKASREILKTLLSKLLPSRFHDFFFTSKLTKNLTGKFWEFSKASKRLPWNQTYSLRPRSGPRLKVWGPPCSTRTWIRVSSVSPKLASLTSLQNYAVRVRTLARAENWPLCVDSLKMTSEDYEIIP